MPYLNETGLSYYDPKLKEWIASQPAKTIPPNLYPWTLTEKAGAVTCWPVGGTPLLPIVDFLFTEVPPASGDKAPDNPSTIAGVESVKVTRCGKNLRSFIIATQTKNGVTCTNNGDGTYTLNGLASADAAFSFNYASILRPGVYVISGCPSGGSNTTYYLGASGGRYDTGNGFIINASAEVGLYFWIQIKSGYNCQNLIFKPQLELGTTATSFEPYSGTDYTLPLRNTYYGGSIDLASGVMTVTMQYMVADSNAEILWIGTNFVAWRYPAGLDCIGRAVGTEVCSHFPFNGAWDGSFAHFYATPSSGLYIANPNWTASTYRQYFTDQYNNGTPVTACYQLANPFTVQLSPTQILSLAQTDKYTPRVNTVYTDAQSVQVGYVKSPIREEQELTQAIVGQGGNI